MNVLIVFGVLVAVAATSLLMFRRRPFGMVSRIALAVVAVALILADPLRKGTLGPDDWVLAGLVALVLAAGIARLHRSETRRNTSE